MANNNKKIEAAASLTIVVSAALRYARRGWAVIPVHSVEDGQCTCGKQQCSSPGKHPCTVNGLNDATTDEEIINGWWKEYPFANVAVATGVISSVVTVDVDARSGGYESWNKLVKGRTLPQTPTVDTGGGGKHFHFSCPADGLKSRTSILPGVDIKADGGYVIMPPSVHQSGDRYSWALGQDIEELELVPMPQWLTKLIVPKKKSPSKTEAGSQSIPEGQRHNVLIRAAGSLRRNGWEPEQILGALRIFNEARCNPPLPEQEVASIAESAKSWPTTINAGASTYDVTPSGLFWRKPTKDGVEPTRLSNFTARIVTETREDDGIEERLTYGIEALVSNRTKRFTVPASQFASMNWAAEQLGARAIVSPGMGLRDHLRAAIQELSSDLEQERVFTHTGWQKYRGTSVYLHGDGAIGTAGLLDNVSVRLPDSLAPCKLPAPPIGQRLVEAIRASLDVLKIGPSRVTYPLQGATYRAVLGPSSWSAAIVGPTGAGKTEAAALAQQHYGAGFNARNLPGSWTSTANANEYLASVAKDALLVLDDFAPSGTQSDLARYNREAERILRAQGNGAGRLRLRKDASLGSARVPRGLILSTGEDLPRGQSLRSRMFVCEVSAETFNWNRITDCQTAATEGLYAEAMSAYLRWLAPRYENLRPIFVRNLATLRAKAANSTQHRRTPEMVANLMIGLNYFFFFAKDVGALSANEYTRLDQRAWDALGQAAAAQNSYQRAQDPVLRFLQLIRSALATGIVQLGNAETGRLRDGKGNCIGWISGEIVYLDPDTAFAAAQKLAKEQGESITIGAKSLWQRMKDRGFLTASDADRNLVRAPIGSTRRRVLSLACETLGVPVQDRDKRDTRDY